MTGVSEFLGVWPVLDCRMSLPDLIAEAEPLLQLLLEQAGSRAAGEPDWHVTDDTVWTAAPHGLVLVARVPAERVDPDHDTSGDEEEGTAFQRDLAERRAKVRQLTDNGLSASEVATRLGITSRQVVRDRARTA